MKIRIYDRRANEIYDSGVKENVEDHINEFEPEYCFTKQYDRFTYGNNWLFLETMKQPIQDRIYFENKKFLLTSKDPLNQFPEIAGFLFCQEYIVIFGEADALSIYCQDIELCGCKECLKVAGRRAKDDYHFSEITIQNKDSKGECFKDYRCGTIRKYSNEGLEYQLAKIKPDWEIWKQKISKILKKDFADLVDINTHVDLSIGVKNWLELYNKTS